MSLSGDGAPAAAMTREERLASYKELREGLDEMLAMPDQDDDETQALIQDAKTELAIFAQQLNDEETIEVTAGVRQVTRAAAPGDASAVSTGISPASGSQEGSQTILLYPPDDQPHLCAPYEVYFDERAWYACVVLGTDPPAQPIDRVRFRVGILGYNEMISVLSEALRPWQPSELTVQLRSGVECHAIHPQRGVFVPCKVERLTLDGTVMLHTQTVSSSSLSLSSSSSGAAAPSADAASASETLEVPLSHVRMGKVYAKLMRRPQLTDSQQAERRAEAVRRKRERAEMNKQQRADQIAQDSSDWQAMMGDLMGVPARGGHKKARLF